jgi:hypothetical protein
MPFFKGLHLKGVGDPTLFTVSLMPFFRGVISNVGIMEYWVWKFGGMG